MQGRPIGRRLTKACKFPTGGWVQMHTELVVKHTLTLHCPEQLLFEQKPDPYNCLGVVHNDWMQPVDTVIEGLRQTI